MNEDKATRYNRLKRRAELAALLWSGGLLAAWLLSGWSAALGAAAESAAAAVAPPGGVAALAVVLYAVGLAAIHELGVLPIAFYAGFLLERRYGLSTERPAGWLRDQGKSLAIVLAVGIGAASLLYTLIRIAPARWWLPAGALFALLMVGLARVTPVLLLPLFYRVRPLDRESLRTRLLTLADRAGAPAIGAYVWELGSRSRKANAALAGLGRTRRILVSDTMLAEYSDEEIEIVLAHEIAHHVHGDLWKGLALQSALVLAGFYCAALALDRAVAPLGLTGPADVAGLPLLLLAAGGVSLVMAPAAHALSRARERRADRFALELTRNPGALVSALRRLGAQNLAEDDPSRLVTWLFHSHPPIRERIAAARAFQLS